MRLLYWIYFILFIFGLIKQRGEWKILESGFYALKEEIWLTKVVFGGGKIILSGNDFSTFYCLAQ